MKWLVFDCPSGISGDMTLGALVDLGVPFEQLRDRLGTLPLVGYRLGREKAMRNGIAATRVLVDLDGSHPHSHRHLHDVERILRGGKLPSRALEWSLHVFRRLAEAEAAVHQVAVEEVHFHEVGAVDAIVDIAGACVGLDWICAERGVQAFRVGQIRVGRGVTQTEHGTMPVPAPAALHLLRDYPIHYGEAEGERVTPTGAALLATFATPLGVGTPFRVLAVGSGAGTREFPDAPNVLRLLLCEVEAGEVEAGEAETNAGGIQLAQDSPRSASERVAAGAGTATWPEPPGSAATPAEAPPSASSAAHGSVGVLTTTIDDMVPEFYGHIMEKLFAAGALDVYYTPIYMKKGRPATQVTVIAEAGEVHRLADVLLNESSTLGVRITYEERVELPRRMTGVETPYGWIEVKVAVRPDGKLRAVPEYESVRRAAAAAGVPLADVYRAALAADVDDEHGGRTPRP